jgi:hypothetical protein
VENRNTYKVSVGETEIKRPLGGPSRRWVDDIKRDPKEKELQGMEWI